LRSLVHVAAVLAGLGAAVQASLAGAAPAALFGTAEFRGESHAALPQWRHVLAEMARESAGLRACGRDAARCPNRATMAWLALLRGLDRETRLRQVGAGNAFVNRWEYKADADNYGKRDHWATPLEFFRRSGDCEDYAIAKYQSLRLLGLPPEALRLVVVQDTVRDLPHAVLAVYLADEVYILDNLTDAVLPQRRVANYVPYYSVNEVTRWAHTPPDAVVVTGSVADLAPARP
jgi:predicted transglutaminase-like cysteine proteinase